MFYYENEENEGALPLLPSLLAAPLSVPPLVTYSCSFCGSVGK